MMRACDALVRQGADLRLLLPRGQRMQLRELGDYASVWEFYGIEPSFEIRRLAVPLLRAPRRFDLYTAVSLLYALERHDRLVYTRCLDIAVVAARLGYRTVCECQSFAGFGGDGRNPVLPRWLELVKLRPRRVAMVFATRVDADDYAALGFATERGLVVANGVEPGDFELAESKPALREVLRLPQSSLIVCYSGDLHEDKGIFEYLACASRHPDATFLVVGGEPADLDAARAHARDRGLDNVRFVGYVPHFEVPRYLLASDLLVMPQMPHPRTDFPRSALKMFDYLASGRPIVSTDFATVREVFSHGRNAWLVPPAGSDSLAAGIRHLRDHPQLAAALGAQARLDARQYSWDTRARRILGWVHSAFDLS
jgi:glycosyltransferase involved in cell wall biosynthesis